MPGVGSGAKPQARRSALVLAVVPVAFVLAAFVYPSRQFHWDTLERAYLLEHPARYLRSWDGTPRSQFLSFAHVLELPLAAVVRIFVPGHSGLRALIVFEAGTAGATLLLVGLLVCFWRGVERGAATFDTASIAAALFAQATMAVALAFWKMGSSGEEKIVALGSQLLFMWIYWRALRDGGAIWPVAAALAFAVLAHTTGAVLGPFGLLGLLAAPDAWRAHRARVARGVVLGGLLAVVGLYAVAAWTTHVHSPQEFIAYITFFHRAGGNNFFEPSGAPSLPGARVARCLAGLDAFFAGESWAANVALGLGLVAIVLPLVRAEERGASPRATLRWHALFLGALWTVHFAFFEPEKHESWTLPAALLAIVAAASLPPRRPAWAAWSIPALLLIANRPHYVANHRVMQLEDYRRVVDRETRPGDLVLLVGGMQNGRSLRGSLWMRYFLATQRDRTLVSLYDVMGVTQPEFWDRPFESPAALQAALAAGRRAYMPGMLRPELERANASGLVRIAFAARGDSLFEITRIEALEVK